MRSQTLVLLAVHLNLIAAGLIRDTRFSSRSRINPRYNNHSSIADTTPSDYSITATIALKAAETLPAGVQIESTAPAKGQFGSVPAFGSGPGAATTEEAKSQTLTTKVKPYPSSFPSVKNHHDESDAGTIQSIAAQPSSNVALTAKQSAIQPTASQSAPGKTQYSVATASAKASDMGTAFQQTGASSAKASGVGTASQQTGASSAKASGVGTASQQTGAASTEALKGKLGNTAMAAAFNFVFATLNTQSSCNANNKDEVVACISGQFAQCSNGKYTLVQCPQGQSCYALPLSGSTQGITVQCASKQDANQRLGQGSTAPAAASPSQPSASPVSQQPSTAKSTVASVPSIAQSPTAGSAQPSQSMPASHTQLPSAANSTVAATGAKQSVAAGSSARASSSNTAQPTQPLAPVSSMTSVSQQPSATQSSQSTHSTTTSVSSQPAAASKESTTIQSKPSSATPVTPTTPKETPSPSTSKDTPSATSTPTTTSSPSVSPASSAKPSAPSTADDGAITVIPIP